MKLTVLGFLSLTLAATSSFAALKTGDTAPDFKAQASLAGKEFTFSLHDALKKGPVVVYFYPAAFTGGCNLQAHTFAEDHDKFAAAGASVIGVSLDSISRLNDFSADPKYCAGKLPVASDAKGEIAKSYDIKITDTYKGQAIATVPRNVRRSWSPPTARSRRRSAASREMPMRSKRSPSSNNWRQSAPRGIERLNASIAL